MSDSSLTPFLSPKGVVVIGVSRDPTKLGYGLARNLIASGYPGAVHFVNPKGDTLLGRPIYPHVQDVPEPVDLAVVLVPPPAVPDALRECAARGVHAAIIASGGFREVGPEGAVLEAECLRIAAEAGMRLVGPNCVGLMNTHLPMDTTFLQPPGPPPGEIALISQSGAMCAAIIDWVRGQGFGLSLLLSLGNQADVTETDMLAPVAEDVHTAVITMYIESVTDGQRFVEVARRVTRQKPIVALKVGRFAAGQRAAASHTGALAGAEAAYDAAFAKAGVLRANTIEEMFLWARALAWSPLPKGRRVAVLTNSGGPGVTAADALESNGLELANLGPQTEAALRALLPSAASVHNPIDMLASATPEHFAGCLRALLADPGVDSVLVISPPPPPSTTGAVAKALIPLIQVSDKPVIVTLMGDKLIQEGVELLRAAKIPEYRFPEQSASALAALYRRAQLLAEDTVEGAALLNGIDRDAAARLLEGLPAGQFVPPAVATGLMEAYGIPCLRLVLAATPEAAAQEADRLGYPLVLKLASADITHKSDVGGVLLNLNSAAEAAQGFVTVSENARRARPEARLEGVHLQRMLPPGQEVIVGVVRDPQFGALVMFGSGGVEVEGLKDVAFALAPLSRSEAARMLESTWAGRKLKGFRSLAPADREAVIDALVRLAQLAYDLPQIAEIEVNPLRALNEGACAIDVRARLKS